MPNYQEQMELIINSLDRKPKLLLHACCAPCSISALEKIATFFDTTLYYYNPNIDSQQEYELRLAQFDKLKQTFEFKLVAEKYNPDEFCTSCDRYSAEPEGGKRCNNCIALRMKKSFEYAKKNGFDYVCTTLTSSPLKNAEYINNVGLLYESEYDIKFLVSDFKKKNGYLNSINLCKKLDIYRQHYCGCKYSKPKEI